MYKILCIIYYSLYSLDIFILGFCIYNHSELGESRKYW